MVAYALAGTVDVDLTSAPIGTDTEGREVFLRDIWPTPSEVAATVSRCVDREQFVDSYANVFEGTDEWRAIETETSSLYPWSPESTYIQEPPFFVGIAPEPAPIAPIRGARCLVHVGDSVTTDHISPAGAIGPDTPAGHFLTSRGVEREMYNSYGSRRGNHDVMTRGTFANVRVRNRLAPGTEGGWTKDLTDGEVKTIYEASLGYRGAGIPLLVLAGRDYGMGSSRDWAAKGTLLLGVRAVIAESYERIHRSNLVGMGVMPLVFAEGESADSLGLDGTETYDVELPGDLEPRQAVPVIATRHDGGVVRFEAVVRVDTPVEVDYYRNGGILQTVLRRMAAG